MFARSFTYGALSASQNTFPISSVALSRVVSYEGKPECTTRLQNTANPTRSAQRSSLRGGWYLVRSVSSASYAGSVRHSLRPHFLWRRFPQFTSGGLYHKIWRRKKTITAERKGDHAENNLVLLQVAVTSFKGARGISSLPCLLHRCT